MAIKLEKIENVVLIGMSNLLVEQSDLKKINKTIWADLMEEFYTLSKEYVILADVRHLYSTGSFNFFPIEKNNRYYYKEDYEKNTYLFSISDIDEIRNLTELYCEDYSLSYIFLKKDKDINYSDYFNFSFTAEENFIKLILKTEIYIAFGACGEYMGLTYQKEYDNILIPVINNKID